MGVEAGSLDGRRIRGRQWAPGRLALAAASLLLAGAVGGGTTMWRWTSPVVPAPRLESIAVLPIVNLLGDPDRDYLVDGLTDTLITELASAGVPRVISRQSSMAYRDARKSAADAGRELGVDAVVEGSVVRTGSRYVVNVRLIETTSHRHRWAGRFERDGLYEITECADIAQDLVRATGLGTAEALASRRPRASVGSEARDAYLRGLFFWHKRSGDDLKRALVHFAAATRIEPRYAAAWTGIASVYAVGSPNTATLGLSEADVISRGAQAALEAMRLDDSAGEPHAALGRIRMAEWRWDEAERELRLAVELSPQFATGSQWYGTLLMRLGRCDEALRLVTTGAKLDPLAPLVNDAVGSVYTVCNQPARAIELRRGLVELHPNVAAIRFGLALSYAAAGRHEAAIAEAREAIRLDPDNCYYKAAGLAHALGLASRRAEAQAIVDDLTRSHRNDSARRVCLAAAFAAVGATDRMFASLEQAFREHGAYMDLLIAAPWVGPYRRDPRYARLLERMGMLSNDQTRRAAIAGPAFTTAIASPLSERD
jgi:TolB-like protein/Tfp pilus assembly protein PilF